MKRHIFIALVVILQLFNLQYVPNEENRYHKLGDCWSVENEQHLSEESKGNLGRFKEKIDKGECLTGVEKEILKDMKEELVRNKLGEEKLATYIKLIQRRDEEKEMTPEEKKSLFDLEKQIRK